ncbi:hypothetical protein [Fibrella arboris]|uniref:hypothetical protein n=1 Tax=Fibrella arboris TaxID=3242486 RepID=UPI003522A384
MPAALSPDLKRAITYLPDKEKDKLLLRLVAKDPILTEKLEYELVENKTTLDYRRKLIRDLTDRTAVLSQDSPAWMMMDMRTVSGYITRHVKVTKDSYGEVDLTIHLLRSFFDNHADLLQRLSSRTEKCAIYVAKRTDAILKKLNKLDPDYYLEFEDDMNKVLRYVYDSAAAHYARQLDTPTEWYH